LRKVRMGWVCKRGGKRERGLNVNEIYLVLG
jgi:hypothetical protein